MRTKGSTSNVSVTLAQLNAVFQPNAIIPIARRFADAHGLLGKAIIANASNLEATGNQPAAQEVIAVHEIMEDEPIGFNEIS